jgi:tripartite-type tricarboxylate transporter receptor subunit TctC
MDDCARAFGRWLEAWALDDLAFLALAGPVLPMVQARNLRVFGVSAAAAGIALAQQFPLLGAHPRLHGFGHAEWVSFAAPRAVPDALAQHLNEKLNAALQSPGQQQLNAQMGAARCRLVDLAEATRFFDSEIRSMQTQVAAFGLQPQQGASSRRSIGASAAQTRNAVDRGGQAP